jgi:hypothetical protein
MVNNINSNLISTLLSGSSSTQNLSSLKSTLEKYSDENSSNLVDQGTISKEALVKYQTEQEISYYKGILSAMLGNDSSTNQVSNLISQVQSGGYSVDNSALSESLTNNDYLKTLLNTLSTASTSSTTSTASTTSTKSTAATSATGTSSAYTEIAKLLADTLENIS